MMRIDRVMLALVCVLLMRGGIVVAAEADKPAAADESKVKKIDPDQFDLKRHEKDAVVLDVRTPEEFAKGHVPDAVNLNFFDPQFKTKAGQLDKSKTYLVHCARGVRSRQAAGQMEKMGFTSVFDLAGGFDRWQKEGKPVEKGSAK